MDVKEAVEMAKNHVKELFASEGITDVGLEEVEFDDDSSDWLVTVGFSRPWEKVGSPLGALARQITWPMRSYKVVRINDASGQLRSVKTREVKA